MNNSIGIFNVNFSEVNDEFDWVSNTSNPIQTISGRLVLKPDDITSSFSRGLGSITPDRDRIRVKSNFEICRPSSSNTNRACIVVTIKNGSNVIGVNRVYIDDLSAGDLVKYNFDREYRYENLTGQISILFKFEEGTDNELKLQYLEVDNFEFTQEDVKTYFVVNGLQENSLDSVSGVFKFKSWLVDGQESLTQDFISDTDAVVSSLPDDWKHAKSDQDGRNRTSDETTESNTFNPFNVESGLDFDNVDSFFGGQVLGVTNGKDYGAEILKLGVDKPIILNKQLENRKGAFFINIDYSKDLKIVFETIYNKNSINPYLDPDEYREYTIEWNSKTCTGKFIYKNLKTGSPNEVNVTDDGFLSGLTGDFKEVIIIKCDETFSFSGGQGVFEYEIDFGTDVGNAGIEYNAFGLPEKFEIEWNNQLFSSGYVGSSAYDQQLLNEGINQSEIKTGNPSTGSGILEFNKNQAQPSKAKIRVFGPFSGTAWNIKGICPRELEPEQRLVYRYENVSDAQYKVDVDETVGGIRTLSIEQAIVFIPENDEDLGLDDEFNLTLDYELRCRYIGGICNFYITENGGTRQLMARQTDVGENNGTVTINMQPGVRYAIVQEIIYEISIPSQGVNRILVSAINNEFTGDNSLVQIRGRNYNPIVGRIGTILNGS